MSKCLMRQTRQGAVCLCLVLLLLPLRDLSTVVAASASVDYIRWVDFTPTTNAISDAIHMEVSAHKAGRSLSAVTLLAVFATKLVAFGSMASSFLFPLLVNAFANLGLHVAMAVFGTAFLLYAHRQNIKRIQAGKEEKFFFSAFFQNDRNGGNE